MTLFYALMSLGVGLLLLFTGYRMARILIPLLGFLLGMSMGGALIADVASTTFLGTLLGIMVGVVFGLVLAVFAYFYYAFAVIVLVGSMGYWIGTSLILLLGIQPGILSATMGVAVGAVLGLLAVMMNAPKYLLIVLSAIAGSVAAVGGIMLLMRNIPLDIYSFTTASVAISNSVFWMFLAIGLAIVGIYGQFKSTDGYELEEWAGMGAMDANSSAPTPA